MMADLQYLLAIYVHAHETGNSVPPHIDAEARWHLGLPVSDGPAVPEGREPTRDELWELWLRLNNELPDRPAAVAEFWEHAQINARARAALADEPAAPAPPADGEVAELVAWLQEEADDYECIGCEDSVAKCKRAAELLERLALPACVVLKPSPELIEAFQDALPGRIEPLLEERHPAPVPVGERLPLPEVGD